MDYIFQIFTTLLGCVASYLLGYRMFRKENLKTQAEKFFFVIKRDYDALSLLEDYFQNNSDIFVSHLSDSLVKYDDLTPYFNHQELKLFIDLSTMIDKSVASDEEIINSYKSLIQLIKVRYNKIAKHNYFPKWVD